MPTRQDQLHSYQFMIQRVVAAVVMRETDPPQSPFRRVAGATVAGVMVTALTLAAVAVYGVLSPGGDSSWRDGTAVIVERQSGARFVYRDGRLHPVVNYTSALLILGAAEPRVVYVSRDSIARVPRGVPLGIAQAPDSLPAAKDLVGTPWTLCATQDGDGRGGTRATSVLFVGPQPGADPATGGGSLAEAGLLVRDPAGAVYLIWHNRRHLVREPAVVLPALGWAGESPVLVAPALLNVLTAGIDLARIPIEGRGQRSSQIAGARIGEVFVVETQGGGRQYVVVTSRGLAAVTQVQADLLIGDPLTAQLVGQASARPLSQGEYALAPKVGDLVADDELAPPANTPTLQRSASGTGICAVVRDPSGAADVRVGVAVPQTDAGVPTGGRTGTGTVLVDRVVVPPGRGAVVEVFASPQASSGGLSVVTDLGRRHEVANAQVLAMLGLANVQPLRLPASLVALLPPGSALDPTAALAPVQ